MDIVHTITSIGLFDWLVIGFSVAMFVLGFAQGVIRRLLGIVSIAFSFLLAAQLRGTLGSFFATNWTQFPTEYSHMIAFAILFAASTIIFALVIQSYYKRAPIFARYPFLDEVLGALLGLVEAMLLIGCGIAIGRGSSADCADDRSQREWTRPCQRAGHAVSGSGGSRRRSGRSLAQRQRRRCWRPDRQAHPPRMVHPHQPGTGRWYAHGPRSGAG